MVIARCVGGPIEHAQDVPLVDGARSGLYFMVSLCSLFIRSTFCYIFITCFSLFCFSCDLFSKVETFVLGLSFDVSVFYSVLIKLENGFQMINLSSFNLGFIRFGYHWFSFLSHAVIL